MATKEKGQDRWREDNDTMNNGPGMHDDTSNHGPSGEYGANFRDHSINRQYGQQLENEPAAYANQRFGNPSGYVNESRYGNGSERYGNEARYGQPRHGVERNHGVTGPQRYWEENGGWYGAGAQQEHYGRGIGQHYGSYGVAQDQAPRPSVRMDQQSGQDDWQRASRQSGQHETMMQKVGRFFGVGPKGHKRSDARIQEDINDALTDDSHIDATHIEVVVKDAEVTLEGVVDERATKRRAEDVAASCRGVKDVHNHLRVQPLSQNTVDGNGRSTNGTSMAVESKDKSRQTVS